MNDTNNQICKQHSGVAAQIAQLEDNVHKLWEKWDSMQKTVIGIFVTLALNLIGVVFLLLRAS